MIIVDVFDYKELLTDLRKLKLAFTSQNVTWPSLFERYLVKCAELVECVDSNRLTAVKYIFGDGNLPEEIKNADIVVNTIGPPDSTLPEQVACLKRGGKLFTTADQLKSMSGISIKKVNTADHSTASILTRQKFPSLARLFTR